MNIAIISDIHDNLINLKKCLDWCKKKEVEKIFCCGDLTNKETLKFLSNNFKKEIFLVKGNIEIYEDNEVNNFKNIIFLGRIGRVKIKDYFFGICHEPFLIEDVLRKGKCDFIFYGHTHKPWIEKKNNFKIINPGTLGGVFQRASFAFWDLQKEEPELEILELL